MYFVLFKRFLKGIDFSKIFYFKNVKITAQHIRLTCSKLYKHINNVYKITDVVQYKPGVRVIVLQFPEYRPDHKQDILRSGSNKISTQIDLSAINFSGNFHQGLFQSDSVIAGYKSFRDLAMIRIRLQRTAALITPSHRQQRFVEGSMVHSNMNLIQYMKTVRIRLINLYMIGAYPKLGIRTFVVSLSACYVSSTIKT